MTTTAHHDLQFNPPFSTWKPGLVGSCRLYFPDCSGTLRDKRHRLLWIGCPIPVTEPKVSRYWISNHWPQPCRNTHRLHLFSYITGLPMKGTMLALYAIWPHASGVINLALIEQKNVHVEDNREVTSLSHAVTQFIISPFGFYRATHKLI